MLRKLVRLNPRWDIALILIASASVYYIQALGWPLSPGRDFYTYVHYYIGLFSDQTVKHDFLMLYRQPIPPLLICGIYLLGGAMLMEVFMGACFAGSILLVYFMGLRFSRTIGLVAALWLVCAPDYGAMYHSLSSEPFFSLCLLACCNFWLYTVKKPTIRNFAISGLFIVLLTLTRPTGQLFVVLGFMAFLLPGLGLKAKLFRAGAFWLVSLSLLSVWSGYHYLKYDDFAVARGGNAIIPFWHVYCIERTIRPENGTASRELVEAIENDLLPRDPYKQYSITLADVLQTPERYKNTRIWKDLLYLSDTHWGWDSDYKILKKAAIEAIVANPKPFFKNYLIGTFNVLTGSVLDGLLDAAPAEANQSAAAEPEPLREDGLPVPSEGQITPYSIFSYSTINIEDRKKFGLEFNDLPARQGISDISTLLILFSGMFPPTGFYALFSLILLAIVRLPGHEPEKWLVVTLFVLSLAVILISIAAGAIATVKTPFDPLFIFGFVLAIFGGGKYYLNCKNREETV